MMKELASALAKAQAEMPTVQPDATNPFLKTRYTTLGALIETARPVLAKHGLSIVQFPYTNVAEAVGVRTIVLHSSGESLEDCVSLPLGDEKGKSRAQVAGSIITYLRRYAYAAVLGLYAEEDTDGNEPAPRSKPAAQHAPEPPEQPETGGKGKGRRPLGAEVLRGHLLAKTANYDSDGAKASAKQRGLVVGMLNTSYGGKESDRHSALRYVFGAASTKELSNGAILALIDWLAPEQTDGGYIPSEMAVTEAQALVTAALKEEGQEELL